MTSKLHAIYLAASEERPSWFPFTPEWKRLCREFRSLEEAFLSRLDAETRALWEEFQRAAFALDDLDREGYFDYALALGIELGRLSAGG